MRGFTKICLIICVALVCISAVCLGAGVALGSGLEEVMGLADEGAFNVGGWHIGRWSFFWGDDWDDEEVGEILDGIVEEKYAADEIEALDIEIKYGTVYVKDSESDQIEITVDAPENYTYKCRKSGRALELVDKTPSRRWRHGASDDVNVVIAIPKGKSFQEFSLITNAGTVEVTHRILADEVSLEIDAGELAAEELIAEKGFSVDVGAGSVKVSQFSARSLEADCGVGQIELSGVASKEVDAECGVGQIRLNLKGREEDYDYEISCGLGTVSINGDSYSSLSVEKEIDNDAGNAICLECGVGEITVKVEEE